MALTAAQQLIARRRVSLEILGSAPAAVTKTEIDVAINACVTWIETNQASALAAMAGTVLAGASAAVKAQALAIAIESRYNA